MKIFRRLYQYVTPYRAWAVLALVSMFVVAASTGALIALVRPLFDDVLSRGEQQQDQRVRDQREIEAERLLLRRDATEGQRGAVINWIDRQQTRARAWWDAHAHDRWKYILAALMVIFVVRAITTFFSEYSFQKVGLSTVRDLRNALYERIIQQSNRFFTQRSTGELVSRIVSDVEAIQAAVSIRVGDLFQESLTLIVIGGVILVANAELAMFTFIIAPLIAYPVVQFGRRLRRTTRKSQERMADIATILEETIKGVRIVKAFGMEPFEIRRFREATQRHLSMNLKAHKIQALTSPVMELLAGVCMVLLFGYAAMRIRAGALTLGQFMSFLLALAGMYAPIKRLNKVNLAMNTALSAAERVFQMLDVDNEVKEKSDATVLAGIGRGIAYENVEFAYGEEPVLKGINLNVHPGEMIAIVGSSGAGKSTLVNLLPRFYDVSGGRVLVDGQDIRDVTLTSLRSQIGYVTQEVILFNDTVRNNIAYGRSDLPLETIRAAARAANAADFIESLPNGYDSLIGEGGVLLSGGQRQRLAIARALLKNPPILILDEATSALDTESERLVQQALLNLMEGRTTLVIAHRLSTVRRADKIIVLEGGVIREEGSHDELLARRGLYRRLYDLQFLEEERVEALT
jgi:ATP-binding cassette, subfamily B, bacterial MsbA